MTCRKSTTKEYVLEEHLKVVTILHFYFSWFLYIEDTLSEN